MELTKEQFNYEIHKANLTIANLQQEIGRLHGEIAILKAENRLMAEYIQEQESNKIQEQEQENSKSKAQEKAKKKGE